MTYRAWNLKTLDRAAVRELTHAIAEQNTEELEYHSQSEEPWTEAQYNATLAAQQKETALLAGILADRSDGGADPAGGRGRADRPHAPDRHGQGLCPHFAGH